MLKVLFLISDEGYGHLVRQSNIINELSIRKAIITVQCRDPLPLAREILKGDIRYSEKFNLIRLEKKDGCLDIEGTLKKFEDYLEKSNIWLKAMLNSQHVLKSDIIVMDMVEEAGILSEKLSKPVIAISHCTWHWQLREIDPRFSEISEYLENCLAGITEFLYPPFSKYPEDFPHPRPINLIAREPRPRQLVRKELGLSEDQKMVLIAGGATSTWNEIFSSLEITQENIVFFVDISRASDKIQMVPNKSRLHDYINASDLVISRGGYSTSSETLAYGIRHLILEEKNHPETLANANLLNESQKAVVAALDQFLEAPLDLISWALTANLDLNPMPADGHLQAVHRLIDIYNSYYDNM